jgi:hypothetical protein
MQKTVYNSQKGRLETIDIAFTDENTKWFDDIGNSADVSKIADFDDGLVISDSGYSYPVCMSIQHSEHPLSARQTGYHRRRHD